MKIKPIAFYLPQFHPTRENDEWWGKGFTEWIHLRKWKPRFNNHEIKTPHPFIGYYDLLEKEIRAYQASLAKEFGIYGFCYYHYWSCGNKLLQKPLELMLKDGEPNIPFMLCWANHNWTKKWDGLDQEILWKQEYGDENEWEQHYRYLSDFFKHPNYIKVDNKPVLVITTLWNIENVSERISLWRSLAEKDGFDGLHVIMSLGLLDNKNKELNPADYDASLEFQPNYNSVLNIKNKQVNPITEKIGDTYIYDTERTWDQIQNNKFDEKTYRGTFVGWDNSPRIKDNPIIFSHGSPSKFMEHFSSLCEKSKQEKSEFIFINAWNEWGEGAVLEPDQKNGVMFLDAIKNALITNK